MRTVRIYQTMLGVNARKARELLKAARRYANSRWKEHQRQKFANHTEAEENRV